MATPPPGRRETATGPGIFDLLFGGRLHRRGVVGLGALILGTLVSPVLGAGALGATPRGQDPTGGEAPPPELSVPATAAPVLPPPGEMARCKALIDNGQFEVARRRLSPIVEQHPTWARASLLLGLTFYRQHRFEAARPYFEQALEADPGEISIYPFYGYTLYALGELEPAETVFLSLLEKRPQYPSAHYALGLVYLDLDDRGAATRYLESTIELAEAADDLELVARAHARIADVVLRDGDLDAARRRLELSLELFEDEPGALAALARILERQGDGEAAMALRARFDALKDKDLPDEDLPDEDLADEDPAEDENLPGRSPNHPHESPE